MYDTASCIDKAFLYGCDVYANALEKLSYKKIVRRYYISYLWYVNNITFLMLLDSKYIYCKKPLAIGDAYLMLLSEHVLYLFVQHVEK